MNTVIARVIAADIEHRTEADVRAAYKVLRKAVKGFHRRSLPAPPGLYLAFERTRDYLNALDQVPA